MHEGSETSPATLAVILGIQLHVASGAWASPIALVDSYTTTGSIGTTGITGSPVVAFQGVTDATLTTGSTFGLGQFVLSVPPDGSTTYNQTPFTIELQVNTVAGLVPSPNQGFELEGILNGTISSKQSNLVAYFAPMVVSDEVPSPPFFGFFQTGNYENLIKPNPVAISSSAPVTISAVIETFPLVQVPEPGTLAIFLCGAVAVVVGLKRRGKAPE